MVLNLLRKKTKSEVLPSRELNPFSLNEKMGTAFHPTMCMRVAILAGIQNYWFRAENKHLTKNHRTTMLTLYPF